MPQISLVGDHGGSEDYATGELWWAAESSTDYGVGNPIEASCLGNIGNTTVSGVTPRGALMYTTGVEYDGTNESSLAVVTRLIINSENFICRHMLLTGVSQFSEPLAMNIDNTIVEFVRIINSFATEKCVDITTNQPNSFLRFFVASGGTSVIDSGFEDGCNVSNGIAFGAAMLGYNASDSSGIQILTDNFAFNNTGDDYDTPARQDINSSAAEDSTGTSGLTGVTSAELVDFANGDFRTKSTSTLATAGTGSGGFIGAFLETSSGITITATTTNYSYNAQDSIIDLTGEIALSVTTTNYTYTAQDASITTTATVSIDASLTNYLYTAENADIELVGAIGIELEVTNYTYTAEPVNIALQGQITLTASATNYTYNSLNATIVLQGPITINPKNIIRVSRKSNIIRVKRNSNIIRVR